MNVRGFLCGCIVLLIRVKIAVLLSRIVSLICLGHGWTINFMTILSVVVNGFKVNACEGVVMPHKKNDAFDYFKLRSSVMNEYKNYRV